MSKEGIHHNTVNYTTLPNSSMTSDIPVSSSVITHMSPIVCTPVSLGAYTPVSRGVSVPVFHSITKPESPCVPTPMSPSVSPPHSSTMKYEPSDNHVHIQQFHATNGVSQISDGVDWKPMCLQNLGNTFLLLLLYVLLILTTIQLNNSTINQWLYKGMQTSHAPSGIRTHHPNTCPGQGSHQTAGTLTHSATMTRTYMGVFSCTTYMLSQLSSSMSLYNRLFYFLSSSKH